MGNVSENINRWYYKPWVIVILIVLLGPLGLVPLWFRPNTKKHIKVIVSFVVLTSSLYVLLNAVNNYCILLNYYKTL